MLAWHCIHQSLHSLPIISSISTEILSASELQKLLISTFFLLLWQLSFSWWSMHNYMYWMPVTLQLVHTNTMPTIQWQAQSKICVLLTFQVYQQILSHLFQMKMKFKSLVHLCLKNKDIQKKNAICNKEETLKYSGDGHVHKTPLHLVFCCLLL